jgi:transcriptional regulator of acetoin/glycerol metabolism
LLRDGTPWFAEIAPDAAQIRGALAVTSGNRRRAAALLGISRAKFYRLVEKHGLAEAVIQPR